MIYRMHFDACTLQTNPDIDHQLGQCLLELALWREKKIRYAEQVIVHNPWGKPSLKDFPHIYYNISHCRGLVACVLSDTPVGVDVESIQAIRPLTAKRVCGDDELDMIHHANQPERMFFRLWTLKESCAKAMGVGLSYPLKQMTFHVNGDHIKCVSQPDYRFLLFEDSHDFIMTVCYKKPAASAYAAENMQPIGENDGRIYRV
jgi:4'-phosphopantetheinyl transferase